MHPSGSNGPMESPVFKQYRGIGSKGVKVKVHYEHSKQTPSFQSETFFFCHARLSNGACFFLSSKPPLRELRVFLRYVNQFVQSHQVNMAYFYVVSTY